MSIFVGRTYCYLWYSSILAGYAGLFCPLLPLLFVSNKMYRHITDIIFNSWQYYNTALLEYLCNCYVQVTGDAIRTGETSLLISNHRTRTDWNFLWPTLYHCIKGKNRILYSAKFILKDIIKHIPGPGWVMQLSCFIYVKRNWELDRNTFEKYVEYVSMMSYKHSLILFPEGTDLTDKTKRASDTYAEKNCFQKYDHVLHPRTTGFTYLTSRLLEKRFLDAVYDITLTYPDFVPQNEKFLLDGKFPRTIRIHIVRYPTSKLPVTEVGLKAFLEQKWSEKENTLKKFTETGHFLEGITLKRDKPVELYFSLAFWTILPYVILYYFIFSQYFRIIIILHTAFLLILDYFFGGFQIFEMKLYRWKKRLS